MSKEWRPFENDTCMSCGAIPEVLADPNLKDCQLDGAEARCPECDLKGHVDYTSIQWED